VDNDAGEAPEWSAAVLVEQSAQTSCSALQVTDDNSASLGVLSQDAGVLCLSHIVLQQQVVACLCPEDRARDYKGLQLRRNHVDIQVLQSLW